MRAEESRKIAIHFNNDKNNSQLQFILNSIKKAASEGKLECWYYDNMSDFTRKSLEELGYIVGTTQYERNEVMTQIKW